MKAKRPPELPEAPRKRLKLRHLSLPLTPREDLQNLCDLEKMRILGRGSGGTVYKAFHRKSYSYYALKVLCAAHDSDLTSAHDSCLNSHITREMDILRKTDCPYVVKCQGIFHEGGNINFVLEYMDGGSLGDLLKQKTRLSESFLANVAWQVVKGLEYLHSKKIVHRDIKPSNILISKNHKRTKIADFGVSRVVSSTIDPYCNSSVGTRAYMSPERFDLDSCGGSYNGYAGDIWSLGLTLLECYLGHFPFPDLYAICVEKPPSAPTGASAEFQSFIRCCLKKKAGKRWTAEKLLNHPFLNRASQFQQPCSPSVSFHCLILAITSFDSLRIIGRHR